MTSVSLPLEGFPDALLGQDKEYMMGIDEAGRGPTLGPMVYGSAFCAVEDEAKVKAMGFMDSKQLTEAKRDQLWAELQARASARRAARAGAPAAPPALGASRGAGRRPARCAHAG